MQIILFNSCSIPRHLTHVLRVVYFMVLWHGIRSSVRRESVFQGDCLTNRDVCSQICIDLRDETFECDCFVGYNLNQDGYICQRQVSYITSTHRSISNSIIDNPLLPNKFSSKTYLKESINRQLRRSGDYKFRNIPYTLPVTSSRISRKSEKRVGRNQININIPKNYSIQFGPPQLPTQDDLTAEAVRGMSAQRLDLDLLSGNGINPTISNSVDPIMIADDHEKNYYRHIDRQAGTLCRHGKPKERFKKDMDSTVIPRFKFHSHVTYNIDPRLIHRSWGSDGEPLTIWVIFKTFHDSGLLMYVPPSRSIKRNSGDKFFPRVGGIVGLDKGHPNDGSEMNQFLIVYLKDGKIHAELSRNGPKTGKSTLFMRSKITWNRWHSVRITFSSHTGTLTLDGRPPITFNTTYSADSPSGGGDIMIGDGEVGRWRLGNKYARNGTKLYIGGYHDCWNDGGGMGSYRDPALSSRQILNGFNGCVQRINIQNIEIPLGQMTHDDGIGISEWKGVGRCRHKCSRKPCFGGGRCLPLMNDYMCDCIYPYYGPYCQTRLPSNFVPKFRKDSYLKTEISLPRSRLIGVWPLNFDLKFKTWTSDGILFGLISKTLEHAYILVGLFNYQIKIVLGRGKTYTEIKLEQSNIPKNEVASLKLINVTGFMKAIINDDKKYDIGHHNIMNINHSDIYIGGISQQNYMWLPLWTRHIHFEGCVLYFAIPNLQTYIPNTSFNEKVTYEGKNIGVCE